MWLSLLVWVLSYGYRQTFGTLWCRQIPLRGINVLYTLIVLFLRPRSTNSSRWSLVFDFKYRSLALTWWDRTLFPSKTHAVVSKSFFQECLLCHMTCSLVIVKSTLSPKPLQAVLSLPFNLSFVLCDDLQSNVCTKWYVQVVTRQLTWNVAEGCVVSVQLNKLFKTDLAYFVFDAICRLLSLSLD